MGALATLARRLGIVPGARVAMEAVPEQVASRLRPLPERVTILDGARVRSAVDVFVLSALPVRLSERVARAAGRLTRSGRLWVAGARSDLELEQAVCRAGEDAGLVTGKACAVDERWVLLGLVFPREPR